MVSQKEKSLVLSTIANRIRYSGYKVISVNNDSVTFEDELTGAGIVVSVPNFFSSAEEFKRNFIKNYKREYYNCPIFYKDGKTSFIPMPEVRRYWRADRSLKRYSPDDIGRMISLRKTEKYVSACFSGILNCYDPQEDAFERFFLDDVILDYSHLQSGDQGYGIAHDCVSIDYKIPEFLGEIGPLARFVLDENSQKARLAHSLTRLDQIVADLRGYFPEMDEEQIKEYCLEI